MQRVSSAAVSSGGAHVAGIGPGMLVLLGVSRTDTDREAERMAERLTRLRIFEDGEGRLSEPLGDRHLLCVSQFTLYADTSRGNRPGFGAAAAAEQARPLWERVCERTGARRGAFGEHMTIELVADGPVTVTIDVDAPAPTG